MLWWRDIADIYWQPYRIPYSCWSQVEILEWFLCQCSGCRFLKVLSHKIVCMNLSNRLLNSRSMFVFQFPCLNVSTPDPTVYNVLKCLGNTADVSFIQGRRMIASSLEPRCEVSCLQSHLAVVLAWWSGVWKVMGSLSAFMSNIDFRSSLMFAHLSCKENLFDKRYSQKSLKNSLTKVTLRFEDLIL